MAAAPRDAGLRARKKRRTRELIADTALELFLSAASTRSRSPTSPAAPRST